MMRTDRSEELLTSVLAAPRVVVQHYEIIEDEQEVLNSSLVTHHIDWSGA
jgi:molybdopterin biosynthesis enzyme MoaB